MGLQAAASILQLDLPSLQALHERLIEGKLFAHAGDNIIQVPMLSPEFDQIGFKHVTMGHSLC
jgi:hypothetical protein